MSHSTPVARPVSGPVSMTSEIGAGFLVFLITLPLCMGIALASGFPAVAGILTSIIGGIICGLLGGARLTIKGAPAGLIVIVLGAVQELAVAGDPVSGYKRALAVGVLAGVVQIVIALLKLGKLGELIPGSVIHGMLAAIGIIIIGKQFHTMMGVVPAGKTPLNLLLEIPHSLMAANPEVVVVGLASLVIMLAFAKPAIKKAVKLPAALIVLVSAILLSYAFSFPKETDYSFLGHNYHVGPKLLISLPHNLLQGITFPDFSCLSEFAAWKFVLLFAIVGSIESILTVSAIDKLDPEKQKTDVNKDLLILGVANTLAALVGGLPMISEVVRSKANIDAGARTSKANFFHGLFLLAAVVLIPGILENIPAAALAGMLVFIGSRLASPSEFAHMYRIGKPEFTFFLTTCVITVGVDLLAGVIAGLVMSIAYWAFRARSVRQLFRPDLVVKPNGEGRSLLCLNSAGVFTNFPQIKKIVSKLLETPGSVDVDLSRAPVLEHEFLAKLHSWIGELGDGRVAILTLDEEPVRRAA